LKDGSSPFERATKFVFLKFKHYDIKTNAISCFKNLRAYNKTTKLKDPTVGFTKKSINEEDFNLVLTMGYHGAILAQKHVYS
jgi:hypothetical protein